MMEGNDLRHLASHRRAVLRLSAHRNATFTNPKDHPNVAQLLN